VRLTAAHRQPPDRFDEVKPQIRSSGDLLADRRYGWAESALADGDAKEAVDLIEQTLALVPRFAPAWLLLGKAHAALGAHGPAAAAFERALAHDPADTIGAGLELARRGARPAASAMTDAFVRALFDDYAPGFDAHLTQELSYRAPDIIMAALRRARTEQQRAFRFGRVLDLGCGTGLMGAAMRANAEHLTGCDLSPRMIEQARAKVIYDRLVAAGIAPFLASETAASAELVLAADVFVYVGELTAVFAAVARVLKPQGLFAFTVQSHGGDGVIVGDDHRYHHADAYVCEVAATHFRVAVLEPATARLDRGEPVPGRVCALIKA
jgi:predicted TPR repeat methyltransferase